MSDSVRPHRRQPTRLPRPWDSPGKNTGVGCHFLLQCMKVKSESEVAQSCLTPSDPMDCSPPGSSIHGIFQARVLGWGAVAFSVAYTRGAQTWDCDYFATSEVHGALQAQCGPPQPVPKCTDNPEALLLEFPGFRVRAVVSQSFSGHCKSPTAHTR